MDGNIAQSVFELLADNDPTAMTEREFLGARFDKGLAWVNYPVGAGGLGAPRHCQDDLEDRLVVAGAVRPQVWRNPIGLGMAAPTIVMHGSERHLRLLRPLWTGEDIWCQLFSEPGAGSDLASVATRAVADSGRWIINGQKVWTSGAHRARWGLLLARTDPHLPKHQGLAFFILDMTLPGIDVKPLRQATGQAEFNEVFLTDVSVPDNMRVGGVGQGWTVALTTLLNERSDAGGATAREDQNIGRLAALWRARPELRNPAIHHLVLQAWVDTEVTRITSEYFTQIAGDGPPGLEGAGAKVMFAENNQAITRLMTQLDPDSTLHYDSWDIDGQSCDPFDPSRPYTFHYLRSRAYSVEGGTSEILLNQIADRVLNLPREPRVDIATPWKDLPK
jgi:alkylation response protein AidB-like acyl-CoA dehydrogenase